MQIAPRAAGLVEIAVGQLSGVTGKFKIEELGMDTVLTEVVELPEELRSPESACHLACVKFDSGDSVGYGMLFGGNFVIDDISVVALYWPETRELECFHCVKCAANIVSWFKGMQNDWQLVFSRSLHEPYGQGSQRTLN